MTQKIKKVANDCLETQKKEEERKQKEEEERKQVSFLKPAHENTLMQLLLPTTQKMNDGSGKE